MNTALKNQLTMQLWGLKIISDYVVFTILWSVSSQQQEKSILMTINNSPLPVPKPVQVA